MSKNGEKVSMEGKRTLRKIVQDIDKAIRWRM